HQFIRYSFTQQGGATLKKIGYAFLAEFASALEAVKYGIEIEETIVKRNSVNPSRGKFHLRIGIHAGDVVHRDDDVIGDGVNIAARIEPLAEAGGICISQQVFDQVENRVAKSLKRMGQVKLKNMMRPLEVYGVVCEGAATGPP